MAVQRVPMILDMPVPDLRAPGYESHVSARLGNVLSWCFLAFLLAAPLAFGTTESWSQFTQRVCALVLAGLWMGTQFQRKSIELTHNPVYIPAGCLLLLVTCQFVFRTTAYRYATLASSLELLPCGVAILMAGDIFGQRRMLRRFVTVAAVFGFGMAMFALVQDLSGSDRIYWLVKPVGISAAIYGPYANHNHYAGLMEMLVPLAVAAAVLERGGKRALLVFAAVIMAASIVFSGSRGGILALVVATAFACLAIYAVKRSRRSLLPVLIVAALAAAFTFFTASDQVIRHMTETQDLYRMHIYRDCLRMWWDRPVLGFGWGTFSTVYPQYQSFYSNLRVNHAHNDYLELLVETGVLGTTLMIWFLVAMFRRAWNKIKDRDDYEGRVLTLATLSGVVALLVHSLLDFNLHIPANAALFFALCSAAATPFKQRVTSMPRDAWEDRGPTGIHFGA